MLPEHRCFESLYCSRKVLGFQDAYYALELGSRAAAMLDAKLAHFAESYVYEKEVGDDLWFVPQLRVLFNERMSCSGPLVLDDDGSVYGFRVEDRLLPLTTCRHRYWTELGSEYRVFDDGSSLRFRYDRYEPECLMLQTFFVEFALAQRMLERSVVTFAGRYEASLTPALGLCPVEFGKVCPADVDTPLLASWQDGVLTIPAGGMIHVGHPIVRVDS
ncbi:MAG: hypothetical protein K2W82_17380 [Candidatus Obscuribacterales bacterium]|nr:hypothetical protein [Candidatus Obscuribacterales bacterium]